MLNISRLAGVIDNYCFGKIVIVPVLFPVGLLNKDSEYCKYVYTFSVIMNGYHAVVFFYLCESILRRHLETCVFYRVPTSFDQ